LDNPEENGNLFENHYEANIGAATWEQVWKPQEGTKRRKSKNTKKNVVPTHKECFGTPGCSNSGYASRKFIGINFLEQNVLDASSCCISGVCCGRTA